MKSEADFINRACALISAPVFVMDVEEIENGDLTNCTEFPR